MLYFAVPNAYIIKFAMCTTKIWIIHKYSIPNSQQMWNVQLSNVQLNSQLTTKRRGKVYDFNISQLVGILHFIANDIILLKNAFEHKIILILYTSEYSPEFNYYFAIMFYYSIILFHFNLAAEKYGRITISAILYINTNIKEL